MSILRDGGLRPRWCVVSGDTQECQCLLHNDSPMEFVFELFFHLETCGLRSDCSTEANIISKRSFSVEVIAGSSCVRSIPRRRGDSKFKKSNGAKLSVVSGSVGVRSILLSKAKCNRSIQRHNYRVDRGPDEIKTRRY